MTSHSAADPAPSPWLGRWAALSQILPIAKRYDIGAAGFELVAGKTQTYFPWDSSDHPYTTIQKSRFTTCYDPMDGPMRVAKSTPFGADRPVRPSGGKLLGLQRNS